MSAMGDIARDSELNRESLSDSEPRFDSASDRLEYISVSDIIESVQPTECRSSM